MTGPRFVVRELEGYRITMMRGRSSTSASPGISCGVLDRAWNYRLVGEYNSEHYYRSQGRHFRSREVTRQTVRRMAADRAAALNEEHAQ